MLNVKFKSSQNFVMQLTGSSTLMNCADTLVIVLYSVCVCVCVCMCDSERHYVYDSVFEMSAVTVMICGPPCRLSIDQYMVRPSLSSLH